MRRPQFVARQSRRPTGPLGRLIGRVMASETAAENAALIDLLELRPDDRVLEIGYGHGATIARIADRVTQGAIAGVDHSELMRTVATRRNRRHVEAGRVALSVADSAELPYPDASFSRVLAVHTIYFWLDPGPHLRECARVLEPGGIVLLGFRPPAEATGDFPAEIYRFRPPAEVRDALARNGFVDIEHGDLGAGARNVHFARGRRAQVRT